MMLLFMAEASEKLSLLSLGHSNQCPINCQSNDDRKSAPPLALPTLSVQLSNAMLFPRSIQFIRYVLYLVYRSYIDNYR